MQTMTSRYIEEYVQVGDKIKILSFDELEASIQRDISSFFPGKKSFLGKTLTVSEKYYHEGTNRWFCDVEEDSGQYYWWPNFIVSDVNNVPMRKTKGLPLI